jgi:RES domain
VDERPLVERNFAVGFQPHPPERMKPTPEFAAEGRVSAKGKPCFYCANSKETAMSEVRPWLGSRVSIARFAVNRKLQLIAATSGNGKDELAIAPRSAAQAQALADAIWDELGHALSTPVTRETSTLDYAPTQIVASFFKGSKRGLKALLPVEYQMSTIA